MTSCPRCHRADITPLAVEGELQRFNCRSCGENFTGPALPQASLPQGSHERGGSPQAPAPAAQVQAGFAHVQIAPPDPSDPPRERAASPAAAGPEEEPLARCPKCQKPYYKLGKKFEDHVAGCKGGPYVVWRKRRAPRAGGSAPAAVPAALQTPVSVAALLPTVMPQGTAKALDISIEALKVQRSVLEAEISEINRTISTLEKLKSLGGTSSTPFMQPPAAEEPQPPPPADPGTTSETPSETASAPAGV